MAIYAWDLVLEVVPQERSRTFLCKLLKEVGFLFVDLNPQRRSNYLHKLGSLEEVGFFFLSLERGRTFFLSLEVFDLIVVSDL